MGAAQRLKSPISERWGQWGSMGYRLERRIGPLAVEGSTTFPFCKIWSFPVATSRRAARRVRSISSRHRSSGKIARAASLGQIVKFEGREWRRERIVSSSFRSILPGLLRRHESAQNFTSSQQSAHFLRHSMRRPQVAQVFSSINQDTRATGISTVRPLSGIKRRSALVGFTTCPPVKVPKEGRIRACSWSQKHSERMSERGPSLIRIAG